ncbi:MAG: hypothetical protein H0X65_03215 [Gemmatimonadetes bacterium]|nr:hypothetical protein [Gemmatimonadota bacterium]
MRELLLLLLCGMIVLLPGCRRGRAAPTPEPAPAPVVWSAVTSEDILYQGNAGGIRDSVRQVVRDPEAYRQLWEQATARQATRPEAPPVDFAREMLLVVGAGRMTPEDDIHVDSIAVHPERRVDGRTENVLSAVVRVTEGCRRFQVEAYPAEIVRVGRFDGPVRWVERRERSRDC